MIEEPLQKSLDRYDVLDRIAVGGMAEVFLAKAYGAHGFEKTLAIKRILPELASDPEFAARFIAEAKVAVKLSHANVVQVFDFGRIGESLFIAMEYIDGLDLALLLRKFKDEKRLIPLPAAFHIAIEIVRALDFAHGHNVVHRDVSPSNILISRAGEVKLGDFGIAVAASPHKTSKPGPKRVMGKWRYMSPEQARGDTLDTRSDLFSAASVLFELFTGEKLFPGDEAEDILKNIHDMPIPKMASLRPGLPSRLDEVLGYALARKPIDRPSRPAPMLRSLIELSYESSIMATALDVADAVAHVLPPRAPVGRGALDDVIRKQLADQSVIRQTAVTGKPPGTLTAAQAAERGEVSTGLFRKIDIDGLSRLESESDVDNPDQATNTRVAAPRARRTTEQQNGPPDSAGAAAIHQLMDAHLDPDRRTEVGAPPTTGSVPKDIELDKSSPSLKIAAGGAVAIANARKLGEAKTPTSTKTDSTDATPARRWPLFVAGVIAIGGIGVYLATRGDPNAVVAKLDASTIVTPVADAAPAPAYATVFVETTPPGAHGTLDDQTFATTPAELHVKPGIDHVLVIDLAGFATKHETIPAQQAIVGERLRWPVMLVPAPATVQITTTPPGAKVTMDGRPLGETPLAPVEVPAKKQAEILVSKPDFEQLRLMVDLEPGKPYVLSRDLKPSQKYGLVKFEVSGAAKSATVTFRGASFGDTANISGTLPIKFPFGKHVVTLTTPSRKLSKTITIVVDGPGPKTIPVVF